MPLTRPLTIARVAMLALATVPACDNAGADLGIGLPANRNAGALVVIDRNFDGIASLPQDTTIAGITVRLLYAGTQRVASTELTDVAGLVTFSDVPIGSYTIQIDSTQTLGDSLVTSLTPATIQVYAGGPAVGLLARLGYRFLSTDSARTSPLGRRAVVNGILLASSVFFGDTTAYLRDSTGAIRLTAPLVVSGPGVTGDSVRVLGTLATRNGQRVLDSARIASILPGPLPGADTLTTAEAASAIGGTRDADLVFVGGAAVLAAVANGGGYLVTLNDGSGTLEMAVDSLQGFTQPPAAPGDSVDVTGVLVPTGTGTWRIRPRVPVDFVVY